MLSLTVGLPTVWALIAVAGGWRHRPPPARIAAFVASTGTGPRRPSLLARLGRMAGQITGRDMDPVRDSRAGVGMVATGLVLFVSPPLAVVVAASLIVTARLGAQRRRRRHEERVVATVPEIIDLFVLATGAGHPVQRAMQMVASRASGPVGDELRHAAQRVVCGARTADALDALAEELGDPVRPLIGVLVASERYGTPLVPALERLAAEARTDRRRRAEEAARKVPVKLLFPLVLCSLPAFALLTVVPLLVGAFGSLRV